MADRGMYAVAHGTCGHAAAVLAERAQAEAIWSALAVAGLHRWRVRLVPSGEVAGVLAGLVESDPQARGCAVCQVDTAAAGVVLQGGRP